MAMKSLESSMSAPNCSLRAAVAVRSRCTTPASAKVSTHTAAFGAPGSPGTGPAATDQVLPFIRVDPVAAAPRQRLPDDVEHRVVPEQVRDLPADPVAAPVAELVDEGAVEGEHRLVGRDQPDDHGRVLGQQRGGGLSKGRVCV